jgi:prevent-host-death family protein
METVSSDDARRNFRQVLDHVLCGGHVTISRYGEEVAVVISVGFFHELLRGARRTPGGGWILSDEEAAEAIRASEGH